MVLLEVLRKYKAALKIFFLLLFDFPLFFSSAFDSLQSLKAFKKFSSPDVKALFNFHNGRALMAKDDDEKLTMFLFFSKDP